MNELNWFVQKTQERIYIGVYFMFFQLFSIFFFFFKEYTLRGKFCCKILCFFEIILHSLLTPHNCKWLLNKIEFYCCLFYFSFLYPTPNIKHASNEHQINCNWLTQKVTSLNCEIYDNRIDWQKMKLIRNAKFQPLSKLLPSRPP